MKPTSSLVFLDSTRSQSPIMLRTAAKYARPTRIQNHTKGLYHCLYSIFQFPPEGAGKKKETVRTQGKYSKKHQTSWKKNSLYTCHIVSDPHRGESDHHKVDGLQRGPALDVLEDDGGDGDEDDAAGQDEEDGGRHPDFSLADLFLLLLPRNIKMR